MTSGNCTASPKSSISELALETSVSERSLGEPTPFDGDNKSYDAESTRPSNCDGVLTASPTVQNSIRGPDSIVVSDCNECVDLSEQSIAASNGSGTTSKTASTQTNANTSEELEYLPRPLDSLHLEDTLVSKEQCHVEEIAALKVEYSQKISKLENDLHNATDSVAAVRWELKLKSDIINDQSGLATNHHKLQQRHETTTEALEEQLSLGRVQGNLLTELRNQLYNLANQRYGELRAYRTQIEVHAEEKKALAVVAEKHRIAAEFQIRRGWELQAAMDGTPQMLHFDRESLLQNREKQLFEEKKNLTNVSLAYEALQTSYADNMELASQKIKALEHDLASANEKVEFESRRAERLQEDIQKISNKLRKSSDHGDVPEALTMFHQTVLRDNTLLTGKLSTLEKKLQTTQISSKASEKRCNELLGELSHKSKLEERHREIECENGRLKFDAEAIAEEHKQGLSQKDSEITSLCRRISELRQLLNTQAKLHVSDQGRWALEQKNQTIERFSKELEFTKSSKQRENGKTNSKTL